jgi:hypothetical protein
VVEISVTGVVVVGAQIENDDLPPGAMTVEPALKVLM